MVHVYYYSYSHHYEYDYLGLTVIYETVNLPVGWHLCSKVRLVYPSLRDAFVARLVYPILRDACVATHVTARSRRCGAVKGEPQHDRQSTPNPPCSGELLAVLSEAILLWFMFIITLILITTSMIT